MNRILNRNRDLPGYGRTGIPAGIGHIPVVYLYGENIGAVTEAHKVSNIVNDTGISVRSFSKIVAVAPNHAVIVDPVKGDENPAGS